MPGADSPGCAPGDGDDAKGTPRPVIVGFDDAGNRWFYAIENDAR